MLSCRNFTQSDNIYLSIKKIIKKTLIAAQNDYYMGSDIMLKLFKIDIGGEGRTGSITLILKNELYVA